MENLARATARACCWAWLHADEGNKNYTALNLLLSSCLVFVSFFLKSIKSYLAFVDQSTFLFGLFLKQSSGWVGSQSNDFISLISGKPCCVSDLC